MKLFIYYTICTQIITSTVDIDERLIGGWSVPISDYPHHVEIVRKDKNAYIYRHLCGGSIIHTLWVLTEAYCVINQDREYLRVTYGYNYFEVTLPGGNRMGIESIIMHEKLNATGKNENDIALLRLDDEIPITDESRPIKLIEKDKIIESNYSILTGFFTLNDKKRGLMATNIQLITNEMCFLPKIPLTEQVFCGRWTVLQKSTLGDTGNGLFTMLETGRRNLIGFFLGNRTDKANPNMEIMVFAKISYFLDWIKNRMY